MEGNKKLEDKMAASHIDSKFINQLISLPVVDNTWAQLSSYYTMAKDYNAVTRFALSTAESGAMKVYNTAQPVLNMYQPQITKADDFASNQLTKIEDKFPSIKKTPTELVTEGKEMYSHYVQPAVDKVNCVREFSSSTLSSVKQHMGTIESSKDYGKKQMQKVTSYTQSQLTWLLQTDYGQQLLHQVEIYLSMSQEKLDKYLPPAEDDETGEPLQTESMARVGNLSKKITKRVYARAIKDLKNVHASTKEAVEKLLASLGLIEKIQNNYEVSKQMIQNLQEKLVSTWSDITAEDDPSAFKPDGEKTNHDLAITIVRTLTHQVKDTLNKIYDTMPETPAVVKQLAEESYNYTESLYNAVKQAKNFQEVPAALYSTTAESILGLQQVLQALIETPLSYVENLPVPEEIQMEPLNNLTQKSEDESPKELGGCSPVDNSAEKTTDEKIKEKKTKKSLRKREISKEKDSSSSNPEEKKEEEKSS